MTTTNYEAMFYNALAVNTELQYNKLKQLKVKYGSWETAWQSNRQLFVSHEPQKLWDELDQNNIQCILPEHPDYPPLLKEADNAPLGLYIRGDICPLKKNTTLAIVGTRKASKYGLRHANRFAEHLGENSVSIVSGLAFGIDKAAHEGALNTKGHTIAVLAHGLDAVYPASHTQLANRILDSGGALISEYPLGTPSYPGNFTIRNRIISGMSQGVILIEAPITSGALHTTTFAANQSRDVFVIPGLIDDPNYLGSHRLIRDGAQFVTEPDQILEWYGIEPAALPFPKVITQEEMNSPEMKIISALKVTGTPLHIDKIVELTNLNIQTVLAIITIMILRHTIEETPQGIRILI
jgi:DNA processing protein